MLKGQHRQSTQCSALSIQLTARASPEYCQLPNCAQCPVFINRNVVSDGVNVQVIRFPTRNEHQALGDLSVEVPIGVHMEAWQSV